ncbi:hypothetical protein RCZ04_21600 [Capnocytophaga sp. HP1101]
MKHTLLMFAIFLLACSPKGSTQKKGEGIVRDSVATKTVVFSKAEDSKGRTIWGEWTHFFVEGKDTMIYKRWDANTPKYIVNKGDKTVFIEYGQEHYLYHIKDITAQKDTFLISATQENSPNEIFVFKCFLLNNNTALWKNKYMFEGLFTRKGDDFKIIKEEVPAEEEE